MAAVAVHPPRALRPEYPVRSERLLLRPLTAGDVDAMLAEEWHARRPAQPVTGQQPP
jgi:hypothetical protein